MKRLLCAAFLLAAVAVPFVGVGCGPSMHKVECKVTLDGSPVEGATVVFLPDGDDKALQASGLTDATGSCVMKTSDKDGVRPGKYKITVTKGKPPIAGMDDPNISSADKMKMALEKSKEKGGGGPPGAGPPAGMGRPGMPGPPGGGGGGPGAGVGGAMAIKNENELPANYASSDKTPFKVTVPGNESPVKLDLKK